MATDPSKATEDTLGTLHALVANELIQGLKSEDLDIRMKAVTLAIKFLKDNNISCDMTNVDGESLIERFEAIAEQFQSEQMEDEDQYSYRG